MTIGIDLSSLQGAHRMRGIGFTLLNIINNIPDVDKEHNQFVFYIYPTEDLEKLLSLLDVDGLSYEIRELRQHRKIHKQLPGRLNLFISAINQLYELYDLHFGDSRVKDLRGIEVFLQTDQSQQLIRKRGVKKVLIIYDIIPYILEWEYLWSYQTARQHGFSRKAAVRVQARRWLYAHKARVNTRRADILLAISKHTKKDFVQHLGVNAKKITVTPLGINLPSTERLVDTPLHHYVNTGWGYIKRSFVMDPNIPFILYVGGADKRRKLQDLVASFNILRAQGQKLNLVLVGDCMQGPGNVATEEIQYALKTSSYLEDIIFMGFVADQTRDWLYEHASAFVFPSRYEGFGLPILEAMSYGTPVISYRNAAITEVAGDCPIYVDDLNGLVTALKTQLLLNEQAVKKEHSKNIAQAKKWQWEKTSTKILSILNSP